MTSWKEIQDLYYEVYLLRRSPGPLPCGPQLREEAIQGHLVLADEPVAKVGGATPQEEDQYILECPHGYSAEQYKGSVGASPP